MVWFIKTKGEKKFFMTFTNLVFVFLLYFLSLSNLSFQAIEPQITVPKKSGRETICRYGISVLLYMCLKFNLLYVMLLSGKKLGKNAKAKL